MFPLSELSQQTWEMLSLGQTDIQLMPNEIEKYRNIIYLLDSYYFW